MIIFLNAACLVTVVTMVTMEVFFREESTFWSHMVPPSSG
jgi:hypothetical protein